MNIFRLLEDDDNETEVIQKGMSILTPDSNITGKGTDKDGLTVTKLDEELQQRGVEPHIAIIVARDMYKNGVKKALKTAFSNASIPDIYMIEKEVSEDVVKGRYYINDIVFASYIIEF